MYIQEVLVNLFMKDICQIFVLYSCGQFYLNRMTFVVQTYRKDCRTRHYYRSLRVKLIEILLTPLN